MANFTWVFDVPTGVLKNHHLTKELYYASVEGSMFMDHTQPVDNAYGKGKGETATLTRVAALAEPTSIVLDEVTRIPEDTFSISTRAITVKEIGRAVPYTNLAQELTHFDLTSAIQRRLRDQLTLGLDTMAANAFKTAKVKYAPTGLASNNITNNGTFGATATENLNMFHIEEIRDYLVDTLFAPMIGDSYVGIFRTKALRGLKRDPAWEKWYQYTNPQNKFNSEIGRMEEIRFIECSHAEALGNVGTGSVLGEGVVFGDDAVAIAEAMTPELRAAIPDNFGRFASVAWYGILEFATIWDTGSPGEAKIVHVGSL